MTEDNRQKEIRLKKELFNVRYIKKFKKKLSFNILFYYIYHHHNFN